MPSDDVHIARLVLSIGRREIAEGLEILSGAAAQWRRLEEIERINLDWEADRVRGQLIQTKYDEAVSELLDAQKNLLASRPQTPGGLRILIKALIETEAFDCIESDELARALVDAPALAGAI